MQELFEIIIASIVLSIAFYIAFFGIPKGTASTFLLSNFVLILLVVSPSFFLHELSHKYVANYFGAYARFILSKIGLLLALLSSFFGVIIAMPGAVYIYTKMNRKEYALTSLAGPVTNLLLSIFFIPFVLVDIKLGSYNIFYLSSKINAFLAFFNLLPIFPLDGSKVFRWNKIMWFFPFLFSLILFLFF